MKRILLIHSSAEMYGSDRSLLNIIKGINKTQFVVHVLLPCEGPLAHEIRKINEVTLVFYDIAVLRRKNLSPGGMLHYTASFVQSVNFVEKYIKDHSIDIVETNTSVVFPGAVAAKKSGIKSIWHIREIIRNQTENRIISYMMNRYSDVIIANSKATGKALKVEQEKIRVIYNAVESKEIAKRKSHEGFVVGMAGRINRWKGQKLFVDAAEIVHESFPDVRFKIAGDAYIGEEYLKEELREYIKSKGLEKTVVLLGQVEDMDSFYAGLDVFVLPSIQPEPFGLVILEAMEYRLPVIATNHGGPAEIITDGVDGFLVDYHGPQEMAERIIRLATNQLLNHQIGLMGYERKQSFSLIYMIENIELLYNQLFIEN